MSTRPFKNPCVALLIAAAAAMCLQPMAQAKEAPPKAAAKVTKSGYVPANGLRYYYEIRGQGEPLLLLHGGLGSMGMFEPLLQAFTAHRQVIAVDLQGHGRTALGTRDINPIAIGDDLALVIKELGYEKIDVLGYSFGGANAFRLAAQHPQLVRRLVMVSAGYAQNQFYPEMLPQQAAVGAAMAEQMKETPMYKSYVAVAPNPQEFPKLLDAMGAYMRKPYDWSDDVKRLTMPVMLVYGDSDMIRPEHIVKFYQMLGGGLKDAGWQREHMSPNRLAILPDVTHYDMFLSPQLVAVALPFLDGQSGPKSWAQSVNKHE